MDEWLQLWLVETGFTVAAGRRSWTSTLSGDDRETVTVIRDANLQRSWCCELHRWTLRHADSKLRRGTLLEVAARPRRLRPRMYVRSKKDVDVAFISTIFGFISPTALHANTVASLPEWVCSGCMLLITRLPAVTKRASFTLHNLIFLLLVTCYLVTGVEAEALIAPSAAFVESVLEGCDSISFDDVCSHSVTTRLLKKFFRTSRRDLCFLSLYWWPRVL